MKEKISIYISLFILFIISIVNLYNTRYLNTLYSTYYIKQIIWYILGLLLIIILRYLNIKNIFKYSKYIYFFNITLLILVLFIGNEVNGSKAWFNFGIFAFEPSEFMKISLTLILSNIIDNNDKKYLKVFKLIIYTLIPSILVFLEPDTGAIIFYLIILFSHLISLKIKWWYYLIFILISIISTILFIYFYINNQDLLIKLLGTSFFYRIERIINFRVNNYQLDLSLLSIFSSGIIRNGFNNILVYIPEGATDFIFAFTIGNFGLILCPIIIICYYILIINILNLRKYALNKKTNYLIISFVYMLFIQIIINISMNVGIIPIIGITLPFLSYGGSSLILYFLYLGIIFMLINSNKDVVHNNYMNN